WHHAHAQTGQNPALRTFLFHLARLTRYPVQLIFCYDSNQRPDVKRGHKVSSREHWMVKPTKHILDIFNMQWITAREAEAQLALMNRAGIIDAVMTDNSDIFVFSAKTVLRKSSVPHVLALAQHSLWTRSRYIRLASFKTKLIIILPAMLLLLWLFAVVVIMIRQALSSLCGHCTDIFLQNGLLGCGHETALGLVRCMDNSMLRSAACGSNQGGALKQWRNIARYHLSSDPTGRMGRSHPALARSLPESFPSMDIISLYMHPAVTSLAKLAKL
ncbi:PIN domain-like protein, partial [Suillus placidus]